VEVCSLICSGCSESLSCGKVFFAYVAPLLIVLLLFGGLVA
jgi:hypothetical protein